MALETFIASLAGTMRSLFHIGGPTGPLIRENEGKLETRNAGDSAFTQHAGADPIIDDDFTTKRYVDAASAGPNAVKSIRFQVLNVSGASTATIPNNAVIMRTNVKITTQYSPGADLTVGFAGSPAAFMETGDSDLVTPADSLYIVEGDTLQDSGSAQVVTATIGGAPVTGACFVTVYYSTPSA